MENIVFILLVAFFIGIGVVLMIEERENLKRLKDSY